MSDALTVLAGGTEFELAVAEINALHEAAAKRIRIAAESLLRPARAVPTAVRADDRRRSGLPASGVGVGVGRSARSVGPAGSGASTVGARRAASRPGGAR